MSKTMLEHVAEAIEKASVPREYGMYDYSRYPGEDPPYVVRSQRTGREVFRSNDPDEAEAVYRKLCREHIAKAAILAMREPTDRMLEDSGTVIGYFGEDSADKDHTEWWQATVDSALRETSK